MQVKRHAIGEAGVDRAIAVPVADKTSSEGIFGITLVSLFRYVEFDVLQPKAENAGVSLAK